MKIEHIAIWVNDIEAMKTFYTHYFNLTSSDRYHNATKSFTSYFLSFTSGARIELMHRPDIATNIGDKGLLMGLTHFAISLGSKKAVDLLTEQFRNNGFEIVGEPRTTGDGYYESVVLDPEGNTLELTV